MKLPFEHPEPTDLEKAGPLYWRSLDELERSPEFEQWLHNEFPRGAAQLEEGTDRRSFLKLMGASFALAGLGVSGCRRPEKYLVPYSRAPEHIEQVIPGIPNFFATSYPQGKSNLPLVVESHENRPTKVEGNPSYAPGGGKTDAWAQASVLELYDQDRAPFPLREGDRISRAAAEDILAETQANFAPKKGKGLAFLAEPSSSVTRARLVRELQARMPEAVWAEYDALDAGNEEAALQTLTGKRLRVAHDFAKARCILSVDGDFLGTGSATVSNSRGFAQARAADTPEQAMKMARLYAVEACFSLTGVQADHRLRLSAAQMTAFLAHLGAAVLEAQGQADVARFLRSEAGALKAYRKGGADQAFVDRWIRECAADLVAHAGQQQSLVVAGSNLPAEAHALAYLINQALGASGHTVRYLELPAAPKTAPIAQLADAIAAGAVDTLVIVRGNPAFNAPGDLNFEALLSKVPNVIRYGYFGPDEDETSAAARVFLPALHYMESWDDGRAWDGTYVPVQPLILPIFDDCLNENAVLAALAGVEEIDPYALVRATFAEVNGSDADAAFDGWLAEGVLEGSAFKVANLSAGNALEPLRQGTFKANAPSSESLELCFVASGHALDGRYANNGWMLERPDPMTRLTWDNPILISPVLAREIGYNPSLSRMNRMGQLMPESNDYAAGYEDAPIAELTLGDTTVRAAVHILPGLADYSMVLPVGLGRRKVGRVGLEANRREGGVGFDYFPLTRGDLGAVTGATLKLTGERLDLANVQQHWSMEGRALLREANNTYFADHPDFVNQMSPESHSPPIYGPSKDDPLSKKATENPRGGSMYDHPSFKGKNGEGIQQWGMTIDLNTCTGCNACVIACQSENNIPIVGKDQILRGREMHWIRVDRYFAVGTEGDGEDKTLETVDLPEDVQANYLPVNCMHCETAPCEQVCPVNATVHDDQGLNVMAYNRCVGTRYCANNCPYKVRRFNFFDWNKRKVGQFYRGPLGDVTDQDLSQMQKNPEVTIRMRGVMEKCTYCVQRIQNARIHQLSKARDSDNIKVPDGVIQMACQQACPADAIAFGDIADETTDVYQKKQSIRDYSVLGYLNLRPRTTYLAKLRNPNKAMPDYKDQPLSRMEYKYRAGGGHSESKGKAHGGDDLHDAPDIEPSPAGAEQRACPFP
ncbi:MAG: TAT-variant-translocated molybdopterin oxidoreductase [Opitutales bacterium]